MSSQNTPISSREENCNWCFGFLTSRNDLHNSDSSLAYMPSPPSPNEAAKWSNSFLDLVNSKYGQELFKEFLEREHSEENLEFWLAIENYRKTRNKRKLRKKAIKICNEFIVNDANRPINISSTIKNELIYTILTPPQTPLNYSTFDTTQRIILGYLENDWYYRFLNSDLYLTVRHPDRNGYQDL